MHAIRFEDPQFDAPPRNSLSEWNLDGHIPNRPDASARRTVRRQRTDLSRFLVTLFAVACTIVLCVFAKTLVEPSGPPRRPRLSTKHVETKKAASPATEVGPLSPVAVRTTNPIGRLTKSRSAGSVKAPPDRSDHPVMQDDDESQWMAAALRACRESRFMDAKLLGEKMGGSSGRAVCLLADYVRQYETLSRDAILRMNGAVEVDLGPNHGLGAFVDRVDGTIVFMCQGRHVRLPVDELLGLTAVRFRITRQYLAGGAMPANDLILAAAHFVHGIDHEGESNTDRRRALEAARSHLVVAASASDHAVAAQATLFLTLIDG